MSDWKETEVGLIPKDWDYLPFKKILSESTRNGIYKSKEYHGRGTRVVNMGEMFAFDKLPDIEMSRIELTKEELEKASVLKDDLLFARRSLVAEGAGKCTLVLSQKEPLTFESSIIRVRPNQEKAKSEYLFYLFTSKFGKYLLKTILRQVAVSGITGVDLVNLKLPLAPLEEQQRVVNVLSCLDAKIENLRRQNETLEQIAQTLFKHWFIDFEFPFDFDQGKPKADGKPYKSSGGAMIASELGDIPEGWEVGKLGDIVEVFMGYPFKSELYSFNSGIKVVRGENVSLGFLRWDTEKRWKYDLDSYTDYFLSANDYVIGMDGSRVGKNRTIILDSDLPLILAQRVARLRTKDNHTQGYINILLMNNRFEKYVDFIKTGTSIPHISGQQIKDFECIIPLKKQIEEFSGFYNAWSQKLSVIRQQIQTLTKTRDSLLPKLMSGQLRVKE